MKYLKNRESRLNTLPTATLLAGKANLSATEARRIGHSIAQDDL